MTALMTRLNIVALYIEPLVRDVRGDRFRHETAYRSALANPVADLGRRDVDPPRLENPRSGRQRPFHFARGVAGPLHDYDSRELGDSARLAPLAERLPHVRP